MANLGLKGGIYVVRFRYKGEEYKKSLKTRSADAAKAALHVVELTIHRLHTGQLQLRDDVGVADFIVSGGTWTPPAIPVAPPNYPTTRNLGERYLAARQSEISPNYLSSQRTHLNHFYKFLGKGADQPCNKVTRSTLEAYLRQRKEIRDGQTVNHERLTLQMFYTWVAALKNDEVAPFPYPAEKLPRYHGARDRDPFKTVEEIQAIIERSRPKGRALREAWSALYLNLPQIAELLQLVKDRARESTAFLLHAIPAYTGMRRGEVLRLRWAEVNLTHEYLTARSRKQSRSKDEVTRLIELHPDLKVHLAARQQQCRKGEFVICRPGDWRPFTPTQANKMFWQPLRGTDWCLDGKKNWFKIGFHTYRHSFASNLAAAGVDQRVIDEFMGHTTDDMRKRYRHLFPRNRRRAIDSLNFGGQSAD